MRHRLIASAFLLVAVIATASSGFFRTGPAGPAMTKSAGDFLATLSADQRKLVVLDYDTPKRVDWHFIPKDQRKGLQIRDMNDGQRKAAHSLLQSALSAIGYDKATKIMSLEHLLKELEKTKKGAPLRDAERYFFTLFGEPNATGKWGLSIEGHHLSLNFVVEGNKVVSSTPAAFASNPATVHDEAAGSQPKGTRLLAKEEQLAFDLLGSLTEDQKKIAVIAETALKEIRAAGEAQPPQEKPTGLSAAKLTAAQRETLEKLITAYAENMSDEVAQDRWSAIRAAGFEQIHFAWAGAQKAGVGHYYRIQGPTFLIEFVNTQPDAAGNPANHIHCIWRDMRGDFAIPVGK